MFLMQIDFENVGQLKRKLQLALNDLEQKDDQLELVNSTAHALTPPTQLVSVPVIPRSMTLSAPAPMNPAASQLAAVAGELDNRGVPHDLRIHSSKKTKNLDGSWREKRGVDAATISQIESQIKGSVPAAPAVSLPPTPPPSAPNLTVVPPPSFQTPVATPVPAPVVQAAPMVQSQIIPPTLPVGLKAAHSIATFKNHLQELLAQFVNEGKIDQAWIDGTTAYFASTNPQVKNIWNILHSEKQCLELFETFVSYGWITRVDQ